MALSRHDAEDEAGRLRDWVKRLGREVDEERERAEKAEREREQLAGLGRYQRRYLARRVCGLCELPLDRAGCGGIYEACPEDVRIERRRRCLDEYRPRPQRRK